MATFNDLINEVTIKLSGYGLRNDATTYVTTAGGFNSTALSFSVANAETIGRGVLEVDDELIWADAANSTSGAITVPPYGRGYLGTTAATHAVNAKVTINPVFTRQDVKTAINDTIQAVYPQLFGVASTEFTFSAAVTTYPLPANAERVLSIRYRLIGPSKEWMPVKYWSTDTLADGTDFNTGKSITVSSQVGPGDKVKLTYTKEPSPLVNAADVFDTVTGLPASAKDVIVLGAVYRLLSMVEPGRLTFTSPDAAFVSDRIQYGSGTNVTRTLFALYSQRLAEEQQKLLRKFPIRSHFQA